MYKLPKSYPCDKDHHGRTALTAARDQSPCPTSRTVRISAQIPRQVHTASKAGIPIITKTKFGAIGVELRATRSTGNPIAIHTGQSLFTNERCGATTNHLNLRHRTVAIVACVRNCWLERHDVTQHRKTGIAIFVCSEAQPMSAAPRRSAPAPPANAVEGIGLPRRLAPRHDSNHGLWSQCGR